MDNNKVVEILNKLVEINNDRIEGYETASKETEEQELKNIFSELAQTSRNANQELAREIYLWGGTPTQGTKIAGKFFRVWMDVKASLSGNDRKAICSSCEYGEDHAIDTYEKVMKNDFEYLAFDQQEMIRAQYLSIQSDHNKVKSMREVYA
jgi:uncharacterized protein (TIGR02284 family)